MRLQTLVMDLRWGIHSEGSPFLKGLVSERRPIYTSSDPWVGARSTVGESSRSLAALIAMMEAGGYDASGFDYSGFPLGPAQGRRPGVVDGLVASGSASVGDVEGRLVGHRARGQLAYEPPGVFAGELDGSAS